jgi:Domain of unknown function (DUF397)/Domain of unknown function (DUF5753)
MSGSFVLFSFGNETTANTVFVENLTSSEYLENEDRGCTLVFDALRGAALSPAASRARASGAATVRDSKSPGGALIISAPDWRAFVFNIKEAASSPR